MYSEEESEDSFEVVVRPQVKSLTTSIAEDIKDMDVTDTIRSRMLHVYSELDITSKRKLNRRKVICFCMYQAYLDAGDPQDMPLLVKKVGGLTCADADSSVGEYSSKLRHPHEHNCGFFPIESLIECYCQSDYINLRDECITDIKEMWRKMKAADNKVTLRPPRNVVAGLVWLYIGENYENAVLDSNYSSIFCLEVRTIVAACKYLQEIPKLSSVKTPFSSRVAKRTK